MSQSKDRLAIRLGRLLEGASEGRFAITCLLLFALSLVCLIKLL